MNIARYAEGIRSQLMTAAESSGDEARAVAERLVPALDAAIRLALQDALAEAAEEITVELAPGSVELRLRGRDPEFVVTAPPADPSVDDVTGGEGSTSGDRRARSEASRASIRGDDDAPARINLRVPEHLKADIERSADAEGLSINSWLMRAAASAVERSDRPRPRQRTTPHGAQSYSGWAR
jgi:predicted HicB family RNase H-like nuclease